MFKKFGLLLTAAALLAFALPSLASASQLTNSKGELLPPGTAIVATEKPSTVTTIKTAGPKYSCATVNFEDLATVNSGGVVSGGSSATGSGLCQEREGFILEFRLNNFELKSPTSGSGTVKFKVEIGPGAVCHFEGAVVLTYTSGTSALHLEGKAINGFVCGTTTISGDYVLSSPKYGAVVID